MSPSNTKSPNAARQIQAAIRKARLPLAEKALLTQLGLSYHAESGGAAPSKANLMLWAGFIGEARENDEGAFLGARILLKTRGLIDWQHRDKATTLYTFNLAAIEAVGVEGGTRSREGANEAPMEG